MICQNKLNPELDILLRTCEEGFLISQIEQQLNLNIDQYYEIKAFENRIFQINQSVVKFYRPSKWNVQQIQEELDWIKQLSDLGLGVPKVLSSLKLTQNNEAFYFVQFEKISGRPIEELDENHFFELGKKIALLHSSTQQKFHYRNSFHMRQFWDFYQNFWTEKACHLSVEQKNAMHGFFQKYKPLLEDQYFPLIHSLNLRMIHGDLHRGNLFKNYDEQFYFLDFDDARMGYAFEDLWMLLPGNLDQSKVELQLMLKGYRMHREFNELELKAYPLFKLMRYLNYTTWITLHYLEPQFNSWWHDWYSDSQTWKIMKDLHEIASEL